MKFNGFLNINKPQGLTSHDVVAKLRKILKIKKIGHTGTLDPFATGVLPIAIGSSTRLIQFLKKSKRYLAEFDFSFQTDTDDYTGEKLEKKFATYFPQVAEENFTWTKEELEKILNEMHGKLEQIPPLYSAIHHNGKRLHELMRSGQQVDLDSVKRREVFIKEMKLIEFNYPKALIEMSCSEGTYVRSIARDLGGHLSKLTRLESNGLELNNSVNLEELPNKDLNDLIICSADMIELTQVEFSQDEILDLKQGKKVHLTDDEYQEINLPNNSSVTCINENEEVVGIGILVKVPNYIYVQPKVII